MAAPPPATWSVYLVRRGDGALYTGITTDPARRLAEHRGGGPRAARALRGRGPLCMVYQVTVANRVTASRAESRIKRLSRREKEALVAARPGPAQLLRTLGLEPST